MPGFTERDRLKLENWVITSNNGTTLTAKNVLTGDTFSGSPSLYATLFQTDDDYHIAVVKLKDGDVTKIEGLVNPDGSIAAVGGGVVVTLSDTLTGNALVTNAPAKVFSVTRISGSGVYSLHNGSTTSGPIPTGWSGVNGPTGTPYTPTQTPTEMVNGIYFELVSGSGTFLIVWTLA